VIGRHACAKGSRNEPFGSSLGPRKFILTGAVMRRTRSVPNSDPESATRKEATTGPLTFATSAQMSGYRLVVDVPAQLDSVKSLVLTAVVVEVTCRLISQFHFYEIPTIQPMEIHGASPSMAATKDRTLSSVFEPLTTSNGARLSDSKPGEYVVSRYDPTGNAMAYLLPSDRAY